LEDSNKGRLSLKDLLTAEGKDNYLDILQADGTMPPYKVKSTQPTPNKVPPAKRPESLYKRDTLIPALDYKISWAPGQVKISALWTELQTNLKLSKNKISIAIVFRVFLELVGNKYISKAKLQTKGKLSKDWQIIADDLVTRI
jgi:hypothetical protein